MPKQCEVCGNPIHGQLIAVQIDGATFSVCGICAKLGTPARIPRKTVQPSTSGMFSSPYTVKEPEFELKRDFSKLIKQAREKMKLSQEELGRKINEKPSVIKMLEAGRLKPDTGLVKKLQHFLKVELLTPVEEGM